MVDAAVHYTEEFLIRRRHDAADMWTEVALRYAEKPFVEDTVHHAAQTAVPVCVDNRHLAVVITRHKQEFAAMVRREEASSHAVDADLVDRREITRFGIYL